MRPIAASDQSVRMASIIAPPHASSESRLRHALGIMAERERSEGLATRTVACPLHQDRRASLLVGARVGRFQCQAGCCEGRWLSPFQLARAVLGGASEARRALAEAGLDPNVPPGSGRRPEMRAASSMRTESAHAGRAALGRVLGFLGRRFALRRDALGERAWPAGVRSWAERRGLALEVVGPWVLPMGDEERRALGARFGSGLLEAAGIRGRDGRWLVPRGWGALLVFRDTNGEGIWFQAAATTERARTLGPKYRNPLGVGSAPFGLDLLARARPGATVVVTEGPLDALSALCLGRVPDRHGRLERPETGLCVVGIPGVAAWNRSLGERIASIRPGRVVVAMDADTAGAGAARRIRTDLAELEVTASDWRLDAGSDVNDLLVTTRAAADLA